MSDEDRTWEVICTMRMLGMLTLYEMWDLNTACITALDVHSGFKYVTTVFLGTVL